MIGQQGPSEESSVRPLGIYVIALLDVIIAVVLVAIGLSIVGSYPLSSGWFGLALVLLAPLLVVHAIGNWLGSYWAWKLGSLGRDGWYYYRKNVRDYFGVDIDEEDDEGPDASQSGGYPGD